MAVRVAEGEIVIKTQNASKNTRGLTKDLDGLSRQSRLTEQALSHHQKEVQRFGLGLVSATSNASALSASLRFFAKAGPVGLGLAVLARGGLAFAHELQDLRFESEKTSKSLSDTFKAGMLSKSSEEVRASVKSINDQIFELNQQAKRIDLWRDTRKVIEQIAGKLGITLDLQTNTAEKAIEEAETKKALLQSEQKRLKTLETITNNTKTYISFLEETNAINEASVKLNYERRTNISVVAKTSKQALDIAKQEYNLQSETLKRRKESFAKINEISQKNIQDADAALAIARAKNDQVAIDQAILQKTKDTALVESARQEVGKTIVAQKQAELELIKAQRVETANLLKGSKPGQQALDVAQRQKNRIDAKQAFIDEEKAVKERQKAEMEAGLPKRSYDLIRRTMAEEAVGLKVPSIFGPGGVDSSKYNLPGGAGGADVFRKTIITPTSSIGGDSLPSSASLIPGRSKQDTANALLNELHSTIKDFVALIKQAPLVGAA